MEELKVNDIVLLDNNIIGLVLADNGNLLSIYCSDHRKINISKQYPNITLIPLKVISKIESFDFDIYYSIQTQYRSKDYENENCIKKISYKDSTFTAKIKGTYTYNTQLDFTYRFSHSCSCPVGRNCKHEAALISYLKNRIEEVKEYSEGNGSLDKVESQVLPLFRSLMNKFTQDNLKNLLDYYLHCTKLEFKLSLQIANDYFFNNDYIFKKLMIVINVLSYIHTGSSMCGGFLNMSSYSQYYEGINSYSIRNAKVFQSFLEDFINNKQVDIDWVYNFHDFKKTSIYVKELFEYFVDKYGVKNLLNQLFTYKYSIFQDDVNLYLKSFLTKEEITFYTIEQPVFRLTDANVMQLSLNDIAKCYTNIRTSLLLSYLQKKEDIKDDVEEGLYGGLLLYVANEVFKSSKYNSAFLTCIEKMKNKYPIGEYLKLIKKTKDNDFYLRDEKESTSSLDMNDVEDLNELFTFKYTFEKNASDYYIQNNSSLKRLNDYYFLKIFIYSKLDNLVDTFILKFNFQGEYVFEEENLFIKHYYLAILYILRTTNDEFKKNEKEVFDNYKMNYEIIEDKAINECLNDYQKYADETISLLDLNRRVGVEYYITIDESSNEFILNLKVGIDKFYIVKDVSDFFNEIKDNGTLKYGKFLEFNHNINNFKEEDQIVLNYLLTMPNKSYYFGNGCIYDGSYLLGILEKMKGRFVYFNEVPYFVQLDELEDTYKVNIDYVILSKLDVDKIFLGRTIFLLDTKNKVINLEKNSDESSYQLSLVMFKLKGKSIKNNLNKFINFVYIDNFIKINVDEEIKDQFVLSKLSIKTYFDYSNKKITCECQYFRNDKQLINKNEFLNSDFYIISKVNNLLYSLGFIDNVMDKEDDIYNFLTLDLTQLKKYSEVFLSDSLANKKVTKFKSPKVYLQHESNLVEVFLNESKYTDEELYQIIKGIRKNKKFVLLKNDTIVDLTNQESKQFIKLVDDLSLNEKELNKPKTLPLYNAFKLYGDESIKFDDYLTNVIQEIASFKNQNFELPKLNVDYRNYQIEGYKWLKTLSKYSLNGILADDMGLGKSLQIIMLLVSEKANKPTLIVCPKSLIFNWINEFNKFDSNMVVKPIYGSSSDRHEIISSIKEDERVVYITSYDSLRNDHESYKEIKFNYMIIDEGQYIKNIDALKSKTVKEINSEHRFALTGTPLENSILDLWSIFDFLMPNYFENLQEFKQRYTSEGDDFVKIVSKKIAPFILRRSKNDVLKDLPPKFERVISTDLNDEQRKIYDSVCLEAKNIMENSKNGTFEVLSFFTRLRQICVDPSTYISNYLGGSGKIDSLLELTSTYLKEGHKILIFSQFVKALEIIETKFKEMNISYFMLTGKTDVKDRLKMVDEFNNERSKEKVFLISLKAGGTGLNLIGADTIIHLDPWWNVAIENQASDRAHRIGQVKNVEVIRLIASDTIEQKVIELQNKKKDLIDKLISDDDSSITKLSKEDIQFILS